MIEILNEDCMAVMARYPDKHFDLAIVDPEFGIGIGNSPRLVTDKGLKAKAWDDKPIDPHYFVELFRVAKNAIIWGGNYYALPANKHCVIWDKMQPEALSFGMFDYAWTSFDGANKMFRRSVQDEKGKIHPCLPAGEKVFFNDEWMKIEDVKLGDSNRYGKVANITKHYAEKLVEIRCGINKTIATWNHPFLIKRENKIYWLNADQIKESDIVLSMAFAYNTQKPIRDNGLKCVKNIKKQQMGIYDLEKTAMGGFVSNIVSFGKIITERFLLGCRYITKILTRQTTIFPICNLSHPLNINGCTLVADLSTENGRSLANNVENIRYVMRKIGIFLVDGLTGKYAKNASSKNHLKQERFLLQKVGSVKIINGKTIVYNISLDGIPAFDTTIGISHNTQKPVKLYEWLLTNYAKPGQRILDTHLGSGSSAIAAYNLGFDFVGMELDSDYYAAACKRFEQHKAQGSLFAPEQVIPKQDTLI